MIKNLTKLGCHLVCCTYYLKIAHYLPHLIFLELTSLCGNWSNDQRTHLFGVLSRVGVLVAGVAFLPFLFVMNHHLAAASGEARLEVTSVISVTIVPSVTLATGTRGTGSRRQCIVSPLPLPPTSSLPPKPTSPSSSHVMSPPDVYPLPYPSQHTPTPTPGEPCMRMSSHCVVPITPRPEWHSQSTALIQPQQGLPIFSHGSQSLLHSHLDMPIQSR